MSQLSHQLPENAPFGHEQKVALQSLIPTLQPPQSAWLSGYFGALAQLGGAASPAAVAQAAPDAAKPTVPLTVLFGTESGNSEACAQDAYKLAESEGFKASVLDMADYDISELAKEKNLLVVVSTWGEGDPPESAVTFHEMLFSDKAPKMKGVRFSVCALGDTSYADFCEFGKQVDKRFEELGAERIYDRQDCDVDFEEPFKNWLYAVMPKMVELSGVKEALAKAETATPAVSAMDSSAGVAAPVVEGYSKKNPFPALLTERILLNGRGSAKETIHLEFSLEGSGFDYKPGDVLAVIPSNCPEVVENLVLLAGFRGDEIRDSGDGKVLSILEILETDYDITNLNASFIKKYAPLAKSKSLDELLKDENKNKLKDYLLGREIRDLFQDFPPADVITMDQLFGLLRKMPPRLYSIASSLKAHPDEVHLTVGVVRFEAHGLPRKGVCSSYLADRVEKGDTIPVFIHVNKNFFLPEDPNTPIIMVGPGTGIAPFRAFTEERKAIGAKGRSWLFFGDQRFNSDFLYQTEWQDYLKSGVLTRMDVAFSRDTDEKVYVQHRMQQNAKELYAWIKEGAYFYVCGDAARMAKDVHEALIDIFAQQGKLSREEAEAQIKQLQKDKRYQRDVY
jgi:sulfite reductase (NADPH) flavoprotein alpha-component